MKKSFLAIFLAITMLFTTILFTGCNQNENTGNNEQQQEQTDKDPSGNTDEKDPSGNTDDNADKKPAFEYPAWLGNSTGGKSLCAENPVVIKPGENTAVATAPKFTPDDKDPLIVRTQETAIGFQMNLHEGETEFNWDDDAVNNKWDTSHVYVDINLTGSVFELIDPELDGKTELPITHRMYLRIARYGDKNGDAHPFVDPVDGVKSNYFCSLWYDRSSIVVCSTTDSYFRDTPTYAWMQELIKGNKVFIKWQVTYYFAEGEDGEPLFKNADYTIHFGKNTQSGPEWIDAPALYDPVNSYELDGVLDPKGDECNPEITGNTFNCHSFLNKGQYVCDTSVHVSPYANFDCVVDYINYLS